jgi:hypothetical protein
VPRETSFGARYCALRSAQERLALEVAENRRAPFAQADAAVDTLVLAALHGERVIEVIGDRREAEVRLLPVAGAARAALEEGFSAAAQQEQGAWYLPASATLQVGAVHLAYWWQTAPRYLVTLANDERASTPLTSADAVATWAVLEPLFEDLALPVKLRAGRWDGRAARQQPAAKQLAAWKKTVTPIYVASGLGLDAVTSFAGLPASM